MARSIIEANMRYLRYKREAEERRLLASPPYGSAKERSCWESGYMQALDDIADGKLPSVTSPRSDHRTEHHDG